MKKLHVQIVLCAILLLNSLHMHAMMARLKNWYKASTHPREMVERQQRPSRSYTEKVNSSNFFSDTWKWISGSSQSVPKNFKPAHMQIEQTAKTVEPVVKIPEVAFVDIIRSPNLDEFNKEQPKVEIIFDKPFIKNMDQKDVSMEPFIGLNSTPFLLKFVSGNYLSEVETWFDVQQEIDLLHALSKKVASVFNEINKQCETYEKQYTILSDNEEISFQIRKQISNTVEWLKNIDQEIEQKYIIPLNWYANSLWSASAKISDDIKLQLSGEISKTIGMANKTRRRVLQLLKQYDELSSEKAFSISVGVEGDREVDAEWRDGESYQQAVGRKYGKWAQEILEQEMRERMRNESSKE